VYWAVIASAIALMYVATYRAFGVVAPDDQHYYAMTLSWLGYGPEEARAIVVRDLPAAYNILSWDMLVGWDLVRPRVVLSVLAMPFVKFMGFQGFVVVCAACGFLLYLVCAALLRQIYGGPVAMGVMLLAISSSRTFSFTTAVMTEGLTSLGVALVVLTAWRYHKTRTVRWIALMAVSVLLVGWTRQSVLIPGAAFGFAWLCAWIKQRTWKNDLWVPALAIAGTAIVTQVIQFAFFSSNFSQVENFKAESGTTSTLGAIKVLPKTIKSILKSDFTSLSATGGAMLVLCLVCLVGVFVCWRHVEAHLFIGAVLAGALYNLTNGNATQLRYFLPGLVFFLMLAARTALATATAVPAPQASAHAKG
jgi:hypothetical protein